MTLKETTGTAHRCLECDYNLTGLTSDRCPECGAKIDRNLLNFANEIQSRTTRQVRLAFLAGLFGIISFAISARWFYEARRFGVRTEPYAAAAVLAGCFLVALSVHNALRRSFDRRISNRFPVLTYTAALTQIACSTWFGPNATPPSPGLSEYMNWFTIGSTPGWVLLFVALMTFSTRRQRIRQLRKRYNRSIDEQLCSFDWFEGDKI